jgi:hypothetical protein
MQPYYAVEGFAEMGRKSDKIPWLAVALAEAAVDHTVGFSLAPHIQKLSS